MRRRTVLALAGAFAGVAAGKPRAAEATEITFWHAMTGKPGEEVERLCTAFNASHPDYRVRPVFKGGYPETLTAAIAAWRAGQAPHLVQMFEVGTGSMLAAGPAVKQVWELAQDTGIDLSPDAYIPAVRGYYSLPDGRLAAMPFNSSTAVMWYNKDAFAKAGLDPEHPPATWTDLAAAAQALKAKDAAPIPVTTSWPTWIQFEQFGAIHDVPFATRANGFEGADAVLLVNKPPFVAQLQRLLDMAKAGTFRYGGRDAAPDALFSSGQAAVAFASSGLRGTIASTAKFAWAAAPLPYDPTLITSPNNTVIGGAALWVMTAPSRTKAEYQAVAALFRFLARPENDADWSRNTGYVPVTLDGYNALRAQEFFARNPAAEVPIQELNRGQMTPNSKGFRLGRMPEIRNIIQEEIEKALQGGQSAQAALDAAVERGDKVLRQFQRSLPT